MNMINRWTCSRCGSTLYDTDIYEIIEHVSMHQQNDKAELLRKIKELENKIKRI